MFSKVRAWAQMGFAAAGYLVLAVVFTFVLTCVLSTAPPGIAAPASRERAFFWLLCAAAGCAGAAAIWLSFRGETGGAGGAGGDPLIRDFHDCVARLAALETELREAPPEAADAVMGAIFAERERMGFLLREMRAAGVKNKVWNNCHKRNEAV
ncbi:hypothetical protein E308F_17240 [Moorella sp. E308F]|nr:hypothetical protein E308F_17240 [Moorella sp. E308F]GEA19662.1 hypothetical protein E306M_28000 [Moorella sp. E306M]